MKIQCQNCGVEHEIDPPSWVVSSGRAFRFRCSSCGYSQSVQPSGMEPMAADTPAPPPRAPTAPSEPARREPAAAAPEPPDEPRGVGPTITPWEEEGPARPTPSRVAHLGPSGPSAAPPSADPGRGNAVFLKQNGQIYMVSDWDTLRRWVAESRVDRHDLVSEGGVRWDPIGSRPDLLAAFAGLDAVPHTPADPSMFPFGGETPFGGEDTATAGWHDDDTEGIPTGLPPLPTDEVQLTGFDAATSRPRNLTPTPPPVARRLPPPVLRQPTPAAAARAIVPPPTNPDEPVPPALPDTVPPPPVRATPNLPRVATATAGSAEPRVEVPITWAPVDDVPTEQGPPERTRGDSDEHLLNDPYDDDPIPTSRSWWPVVLGGGLTLGVFALVVGLVGAQLAAGTPIVPGPRPSLPDHPLDPDVRVEVGPDPVVRLTNPDPVPEQPDPAPVFVPDPDASEVRGAVPEPVRPDPQPVPAPQPVDPVPVPPPDPVRPRPSPGRSVASLVDRGWEKMDADPAAARAAFQEALGIAPGDGDANFGYGYALLTSGSAAEAKRYLCKGLDSKNAETRREAQGVLENHGLACP